MGGALGRVHDRRCGVPLEIERGQVRIGWVRRSLHVRFFGVHGIELAVFRIGRIESKRNNTGRIAKVRHKLRENVGEIEIRSELLACFIQDIDRGTLIVDEKTGVRLRRVCRFGAQRIHTAQLCFIVDRPRSRSTMCGTRNRQTRIIFQQNCGAVFADL